MGRQAADGDFAEFRQKILANAPEFDGLSVAYQSIRGDQLDFAWTGDFVLNGETQDLQWAMHYEGPYCMAEWPAKRMALGFDKDMLLLSFERDSEAEALEEA